MLLFILNLVVSDDVRIRGKWGVERGALPASPAVVMAPIAASNCYERNEGEADAEEEREICAVGM